MNEDTIVRTIPLHPGRRAEWFADANVIGLAPGLSECEQEEAITELQAEWRRSGMRLIPGRLGVAVAAATVGAIELIPLVTSQPLA